MTVNEDGVTITATLKEWGELGGAAAFSHRFALEKIKKAEKERDEAIALMEAALNKESLVRQLTDMKNALNAREDAAAQVVRLAEGFIAEVYHTQGGVSRTKRSDIENKMKELRGY